MASPLLIDMNELFARMKDEGLIMVNASELAELRLVNLREMRRQLMKKKAIPFGECIRAQFFTLKSVEGMHHWRRDDKFRPGEVYQDSKGKWHIMVSAIIRLGGNID